MNRRFKEVDLIQKNIKKKPLKMGKMTILAFLTVFAILISILPASFAVEDSTATATGYSIATLDGNVGADVTQNPEISNNIPRTELATQVLERQKSGSTVLQFGNGSGNKLLIWAGIHGNEEEANLATMQYLEYIKTQRFNGTLYVVPFAIPKSTAVNRRTYGPIPYTYTERVPYKKVKYLKKHTRWYKKAYRHRGKRYHRWKKSTHHKRAYKWLYKPVQKTGYKYEDPNRVANVAGTPGWNVVEFARNNGINYILDVHSGSGLDTPKYANGAIFATDPPFVAAESGWANYIKSITNCEVEYGGGEPGMVRIWGHRFGINTITLEVERDTGSTRHYADVGLKMIKAACKYFGFPG
ncbi:MAG: hypothetical protein BME94_03350 [Methanobacteriales archaeon Met13]